MFHVMRAAEPLKILWFVVEAVFVAMVAFNAPLVRRGHFALLWSNSLQYLPCYFPRINTWILTLGFVA